MTTGATSTATPYPMASQIKTAAWEPTISASASKTSIGIMIAAMFAFLMVPSA